jgi:hypothetical protein
MDCAITTLQTLIACFSWSNLYVDGGLQFNDYDTLRPGFTDAVTIDTPSVTETIRYQTAIAERDNPYGRLALGYEIELSSVSLRLEASHVSSFATDDDRGLNAITFGVRWYPFR